MLGGMGTILITGGAGYIGSHVARVLHEAGHRVRVIDDLSMGHRRALAPEAEFIRGDLRRTADVERALAGGVEAVVHLAAKCCVEESFARPREYYAVNVMGSLNLLEAMVRAGVDKVVYSSSCSVYGRARRLPLDEEHPREPISPYGRTKRAVEGILDDLGAAHGLRCVALRYFNAAGAHPDGTLGESHDPETHLIPIILRAALGHGGPVRVRGDDYETPDGTCVRDYVHVTDLAQGHRLALDHLLGGGESDVYRDMLNDEMAKLISRTGGIGVADAVLREMLKMQEVT